MGGTRSRVGPCRSLGGFVRCGEEVWLSRPGSRVTTPPQATEGFGSGEARPRRTGTREFTHVVFRILCSPRASWSRRRLRDRSSCRRSGALAPSLSGRVLSTRSGRRVGGCGCGLLELHSSLSCDHGWCSIGRPNVAGLAGCRPGAHVGDRGAGGRAALGGSVAGAPGRGALGGAHGLLGTRSGPCSRATRDRQRLHHRRKQTCQQQDFSLILSVGSQPDRASQRGASRHRSAHRELGVGSVCRRPGHAGDPHRIGRVLLNQFEFAGPRAGGSVGRCPGDVLR